MADNDQYNDEYQFADLDSMGPDAGDQVDEGGDKVASEPGVPEEHHEETNIKRNALIALAVVVLLMVLYKLVGFIFSEKKMAVKTQITPVTVSTPINTQPQPTSSVPEAPASSSNTKISQELTTLDAGQQSMRSDISSVNGQLVGITTSLNDMTAKLAELNGIIANLSAKVDEQSREIERVTVRREIKKINYSRHNIMPRLRYNIQAVIPGRAWLIASNGSTLTVREGTLISGYGMVKLIDPNQGRVTTSSGQVIKFSQEDS